jgi:hypothetical protein
MMTPTESRRTIFTACPLCETDCELPVPAPGEGPPRVDCPTCGFSMRIPPPQPGLWPRPHRWEARLTKPDRVD